MSCANQDARSARQGLVAVSFFIGSEIMGIANVTWEDEENNRHVEFSVAYAVENKALTIREVTPKSVAFLCNQRTNTVRSIGVHTSTGRKLLAQQFKQSSQFETLAKQISDQNTALTA